MNENENKWFVYDGDGGFTIVDSLEQAKDSTRDLLSFYDRPFLYDEIIPNVFYGKIYGRVIKTDDGYEIVEVES